MVVHLMWYSKHFWQDYLLDGSNIQWLVNIELGVLIQNDMTPLGDSNSNIFQEILITDTELEQWMNDNEFNINWKQWNLYFWLGYAFTTEQTGWVQHTEVLYLW